jgi:alkylation response protein AidB-like acyl-CoA dehydrogenase
MCNNSVSLEATMMSEKVHGGAFLQESKGATFHPEQLGMEDRLMAETAERFVREQVIPLVPRLEQDPSMMRELLREAGGLGLLGIDLPISYGGLALSKTTSALIAEKIALEPSFSVSHGVHTSVGCYPLIFFGTEHQKAKYLPSIATGDVIGAYALTEPEAGSDALAGRTRAVLDGSVYRLTGNKMWITNAGFAGLFITFAKVDGERFTAFIVERDSPGLQVEREEHKLGLKGSSTCRLTLEDVPVPMENRLGEEGDGAYVALFTLNLGRFKIGTASMGLAKEVFQFSMQYASERKQFGQLIADFDLIRQKFAFNYARIYACESAAYRLAGDMESLFGVIEEAHPHVQQQYQQAAAEMAAECALIKVAATETLHEMVDDALQVHGGYGFSEEFPIARLYRDTRVNRIYEGTNEINRINLVERLLKLLQKGTLHLPVQSVPTTFVSDSQELISLLRATCSKALCMLHVQDHVSQSLVAPLSEMLIAFYLLDSAHHRALQTEEQSHFAATALFHELTARALQGWAVDLLELLPDKMPEVRHRPLSELCGALWESLKSRE